MEIINCKQGSDEWYEARMGIPTASEFSTILSKGRGSAPSKVRQTYLCKLAGELITEEPVDHFESYDMKRGHEMEPHARKLYAAVTDTKPEVVGFVRNGGKGASPDALVGDEGMLEIKTKAPHLQIALLLDGDVPKWIIAQIQGQMWVCDREWNDFVSYWPGLPLFRVRVERDHAFIAKLRIEVDDFISDLLDLTHKIRGMS